MEDELLGDLDESDTELQMDQVADESAWEDLSQIAVETFVLIAMAGGDAMPVSMKCEDLVHANGGDYEVILEWSHRQQT